MQVNFKIVLSLARNCVCKSGCPSVTPPVLVHDTQHTRRAFESASCCRAASVNRKAHMCIEFFSTTVWRLAESDVLVALQLGALGRWSSLSSSRACCDCVNLRP
eukprot:4309990-Amphidinium_carterae.1